MSARTRHVLTAEQDIPHPPYLPFPDSPGGAATSHVTGQALDVTEVREVTCARAFYWRGPKAFQRLRGNRSSEWHVQGGCSGRTASPHARSQAHIRLQTFRRRPASGAETFE